MAYKQKKLTVLIANDDAFQLLILTTSLSQLKCIDKIDKATNGKEAIDMVKQNQNLISDHSFYYDLIFLDLNMPICDGYEACTKIKQFYEDL